jgi:hypothetical protein
MSVPFPVVIPRGATLTPHLVRVSGDLVSPLGGPTQRITRLGSRYAVDVALPPLDAACAASWLSAPLQAEAIGDTLTLTMPQMIVAARTLGPAHGGGAAGSNVLTLTDGSPPLGAWLSFAFGGRNYLHLVIGQPAAGQIAVSPLLRVTIPNTTPLELAAPQLEGFADDTAWSLEYVRFVGHKFTLTENA